MASASWEGARLVEGNVPALVSLRARGGALMRVAHSLGFDALPLPNRVHVADSVECLWLRPNEWLVSCRHEEQDTLMTKLQSAIGDNEGALIDVSSSRVVLELAGAASRTVLASCCPLDLHARAFGSRGCAQSIIGKAPVLLQLVDTLPTWRIYARPSLCDYVVRWLADGMIGVRADTVWLTDS
jgi:sarcosine oxidase subunit gamma